jgi:hypothetical protein
MTVIVKAKTVTTISVGKSTGTVVELLTGVGVGSVTEGILKGCIRG